MSLSPSLTTIVTVPEPYHPIYDTFAELWRDSYNVALWTITPHEVDGIYSLTQRDLASGVLDRGFGGITAAQLTQYHMSSTGEYIVFQGHDLINNLYCLVGGYSRIFTVDPQTQYVRALLPIWRGGTYLQLLQAQDALGPLPTYTTNASGVAVYREAPVCAGNPTASPG